MLSKPALHSQRGNDISIYFYEKKTEYYFIAFKTVTTVKKRKYIFMVNFTDMD